ncbi:Carboxylesterase type B protein [Rutstroemia sp. NJR-2017a BBW]|nr:Carboxylesterase type B protein [Rutstroemia sp. NJR-2017a BBW]
MASTTLRKRLAIISSISLFTIALLYYWRFQYSPEAGEEMVIPDLKTPDHDLTSDPKLLPSPATETVTTTPTVTTPDSAAKISPKIQPTVTFSQGTFVGKETEKYPTALEEFLGIPYAVPPVNELRFHLPVAVNASRTLFDATKPSPRCISGPQNQPQSEDCLRLNIFRHKLATNSSSKLPVLVHVHGGAFNFGNANDREIASLVGWSVDPMIAVTFDYRLGALGFLPSKLMADNGLLNLGLRDQRLLLEWVQKNIASFGGDPDNVTLMGPSAGAHSIGHHLMNNDGTRPLFAKAILESGGPTARAVYSYNNSLHEEQFSQFLAKLDLSSIPEDQILEKLRSLLISEIHSASEAIFSEYDPSLRWPFQPCIDGPGGMIPVPPIQALLNDTYHHVPILVGYNTNEGTIFVPEDIFTSGEFIEFFHVLLPMLTLDDLGAINSLYPNPIFKSESPYLFNHTAFGVGIQYRRLERAYADFAYISPVRHLAYFMSGEHIANSSLLPSEASDIAPPRRSASPPVYLYEFAVNTSALHGAHHGSQDPFPVFSSRIAKRSETIKEIAGLMHAYWTSFIISPNGDPNEVPGRLPKRSTWEKYGGKTGERRKMSFGVGNDEMAGGKQKGQAASMGLDDERRDACDFWWERVGTWEV